MALRLDDIPDSLTGKASGDAYDAAYDISGKKHKVTLRRLDHVYEIVSHPATVVIVFGVLALVFIATRYVNAALYIPVLAQISADTLKFLSYLFAVVVSSVFTRFFEIRRSGFK